MKFFKAYADAVACHDTDGGYLLDLGWELTGTGEPTQALPVGADLRYPGDGCGPIRAVYQAVYLVCDEAAARDRGRTTAELEALAPSYREAG